MGSRRRSDTDYRGDVHYMSSKDSGLSDLSEDFEDKDPQSWEKTLL